MAVIKHVSSIKASSLALLKYIAGAKKQEEVKLITGLNCSTDPNSAFLEMSLCYESYAGEKFSKIATGNGKQKIKMHHYVMSFKEGEVTPELAHKIGEEWAKTVWGDDHQILIATHTDTDNIHVHFAVNAYDLKGRHWLDNKKTLKNCRDISDKLMRKYHLSVIENSSRGKNYNYAEWLARQNCTSWKEKLCDDIDRIVLLENVKSISDLAGELSKCGYVVNLHKYLSVKPAYLEKCRAVRTLRLGDGYGLEELQYRIENKDKEMPIEKVLSYSGIQRGYALCLRELQITFYRKKRDYQKNSYGELRRNADLLTYICENKIHSKEDFERHVNSVAEYADKVVDRYKTLENKIEKREYIAKNGERYLELSQKYYETSLAEYAAEISKMEPCRNIYDRSDIDKAVSELALLRAEFADMQDEYEKSVAEKKAAGTNYRTFLRQIENDYSYIIKSAKKEIEEYENSQPKSEPPKNNFSETAESTRIQEEKAIAKAAEEERLRAKKQAEQERRNRDRYSR